MAEDAKKSGSLEVITIDLSESQNANRFQGDIKESLLQKTALERVTSIIKELSGKLDRMPLPAYPTDDWAYPRRHDVITINGERGSGKTTFILNILELISTLKWRDDNKIKCSIKNLGIIDPTLVEDREHIFLAVIGRIKEVVEKKCECGRAGKNSETIDARYQQWHKSLSKLAWGLRDLGQKKDWNGDSWTEPQFILEQGLENSCQSEKLEQHFHHFVEASLGIIEEDAFIIALDDVDTKAGIGWPVLEVMRKYLTTQRLIVILSGDISLYTKLIFHQQCQQMAAPEDTLIRGDVPAYFGHKDLVEDLTEQYMMKIMRPDYRIEMQTVAQIAKGSEIEVKYGNGTRKNIAQLLREFCAEIYGSEFQQDYLAKVLTEVPTRTCIQLLNTATSFLVSCSESNKDEKKKTYMEAVAGLGHVFQNALARAGLSSKLVNEVDAEHMTLGRLAVALKKQNLLKQGHLFPSVEKTWQRQLMMILGAVYTRSLASQPSTIFGFPVYMCLPAYLQRILDKENFDSYFAISQLETEFEAINTVKRGTVFILEEANRHKDDNNIRIASQFCLIKMDRALKPVTSWHHYLLNMTSVFAEIDGSIHRHISFNALLGAIATLTGSVKDPKDKDSVIKIMRQYGSEGNPGSGHDGTEANPAPTGTSQDDFAKLFAKWCWSFPEKSVSLLALTESWDRFSSASKMLNQSYNNSGDYLQGCIILYLSQLLEYEMVIMGIDPKTEHDDHARIDKRFAGNLKQYAKRRAKEIKEKSDKICRIFDHVFSCPVWMHFINLDSQENGDIKQIINCYCEFVSEKAKEKKNDKVTIEELVNISRCEKGTQSTNLFCILNQASTQNN